MWNGERARPSGCSTKIGRWMIARVEEDVYRGDVYCVVSYRKEDNNPEYERVVLIGIPRLRWKSDLRRYGHRPAAVGA